MTEAEPLFSNYTKY